MPPVKQGQRHAIRYIGLETDDPSWNLVDDRAIQSLCSWKKANGSQQQREGRFEEEEEEVGGRWEQRWMTFDVNRFRVKFRGRLNQPHTLTGWTRSRRGEEEPREKNKQERKKRKKKRINWRYALSGSSISAAPEGERNAGLGGGEKKSICVRAQTGDPIFQ